MSADVSGQASQLQKLKRRINQVLGGGVVAVLVWIVIVLLVGNSGQGRFATIGAFGDAMAFIGMLAASGALYVSAYSMLLQREDIDHQIREMTQSREAHQAAAAAQKESADATRRLAEAQSSELHAKKVEELLRVCREIRIKTEQATQRLDRRCDTCRDRAERMQLAGRASGGAYNDVMTELNEVQRGQLTMQQEWPKLRDALLITESKLIAELVSQGRNEDLGALAVGLMAKRAAWLWVIASVNSGIG